jgi:DeoR family transcriptional regulator, glycerol-3-phosphate regulon repressor
VRIAHMSDIDVFVTDRLTSANLRTVCETHGVNVIEALGPGEEPPPENDAED